MKDWIKAFLPSVWQRCIEGLHVWHSRGLVTYCARCGCDRMKPCDPFGLRVKAGRQ